VKHRLIAFRHFCAVTLRFCLLSIVPLFEIFVSDFFRTFMRLTDLKGDDPPLRSTGIEPRFNTTKKQTSAQLASDDAAMNFERIHSLWVGQAGGETTMAFRPSPRIQYFRALAVGAACAFFP